MYRIDRDPRAAGEVIKQNSLTFPTGEVLEYLTFPALEETGLVRHLVTTRTGGVSRGEFASMNLSFTRGDSEEDVRENYRRIGGLLGCPPEAMVASYQTHTTNIRLVTREDAGKGVTRQRDYRDVDGLVTNVPGLALVTFYADCVPLLFVDTAHGAIGAAHSGWRGTVGRMGACMIKAMGESFGTRPEDLKAAIGPSICQSCYEVSEEVAGRFAALDRETESLRGQILESGIYRKSVYGGEPKVVEPGRQPGKYQLDLWLANLLILLQAGILLEQISVTDICTCHNASYLFSHRVNGDRRGNLAAFLMLDAQL